LKTVSNLNVQLKSIDNTFFGGDDVTVSGLLTGQDIIAQLKEQDLGDMVLFSNRILNEDDTLTLDDMTLSQISQVLEVPVRVVGDSPIEFFAAINHG
jgi:NifB/MoaA-like Fe-S oxidoreductase